MIQNAVSHTRPAPQRRPGVRGGSSWQVPLALVVLSLIRYPSVRRASRARRAGRARTFAALAVSR